jgi:hypothetical protein
MTDRAKYWGRMMAAWESSGLTQAEFCRRRGLKAVTFAWWKRQLAGTTGRGGRGRIAGGRVTRRRTSAGPSKPAFVEVALPGAAVTDGSSASAPRAVLESGYEVALPCGTSIRLPADFDVYRVSGLIRALLTDECTAASSC